MSSSSLGQRIPDFVVDKTLGRSVFAQFRPSPRPILCELDEAELRVEQRLLLRDVRVRLSRHSRVELAGPNGAGKSTLLRALLARSPARAREILFVPQELDQAAIAELARWVTELSRDTRGRVLSIVAALGVDPERLLASKAWSPGEARKLSIARGLAEQAHALVLDEPTNHLDLPSIERLQAALLAYPGALLVVSHDSHFSGPLTDTIWVIEGEALEVRSRSEART